MMSAVFLENFSTRNVSVIPEEQGRIYQIKVDGKELCLPALPQTRFFLANSKILRLEDWETCVKITDCQEDGVNVYYVDLTRVIDQAAYFVLSCVPRRMRRKTAERISLYCSKKFELYTAAYNCYGLCLLGFSYRHFEFKLLWADAEGSRVSEVDCFPIVYGSYASTTVIKAKNGLLEYRIEPKEKKHFINRLRAKTVEILS